MKEKILKSIINKHNATGGNNGISLVTLKNDLNIDIKELKSILNELHKEKKITVKKGSNGTLVFLK